MTLRPVGSPRRNYSGRIRANVDRLDHRTLLSGATVMVAAIASQNSTLSIVATSPASSTVVAVPPSVISISFDRSIDPFTVGISDFQLEHLASNGSTTPLGSYEPTLGETLDSSGTKILLTPSSPLPTGSYRLVLSSDEAIQGLDGTSITGKARAAKVDDFRIGSVGLTVAGSADLGVPTSTVSTVSGSLDFSANADPVNLYKVEIPAGQFDRLGVEVSSTRDHGSLQTELSLFDASGHLITTSTAGRPDFPLDPYLFAGIGSGTYYIGVSGGGDVPGRPGGYDLSSGQYGTSGVAQVSGKYRLHLVADPVTQPTQVLGVQVDHADPESTVPTGLTIQFSGTIQAASLDGSGQGPVELVGSSGQVWALTTTSYDDSTARLSLCFDQVLPTGTYSLVMTGQDSLVDLAGMVPVAKGQPQGVLGTVSVTGGVTSPGDLGALLPDVASAGLNASIPIAAGASVTEDITIVEWGTYVVKGLASQVELGVSMLGGSASNLPTSMTGQVLEQDLDLTPGVYALTFTNSGSVAVNQSITVDRKAVSLESFVESGIGQGPALSLRLVSPASFATNNALPTGVDPQPASVTGSNASTTSLGPVQTPSNGDSYGATVLNAALPGFISVGTPVGRPTVQSQYISVVGPAGNAESAAMTSNSDGLPGGSRLVPVSISLGALPRSPEVPADTTILAGARSSRWHDMGLTDRSASQADEMLVDQLIQADASWIEKIVGWTVSKFDAHSTELASSNEVPAELAVNDSPSSVERSAESGVETASLASPIGFGVAVIIALRYRDRKSGITAERRGPKSLLKRSS